jgi:hypothetical protein
MHITDALPLPPRPDLSQYRELAKELLAVLKSTIPTPCPTGHAAGSTSSGGSPANRGRRRFATGPPATSPSSTRI